MLLYANYLYIQFGKIIATIFDLIDFRTQKLNKKIITKPKTYFEPLQYASHTPKINILVLPCNALTSFQLFFLNKQLNTIAKNTNKNAKIEVL